MPDFHLDLETTSLCDIDLGSYRYGADPSTRILLMAVAKEDGEPVVWRFNEPNHPESIAAVELLEEAIPPGDRIYAHNAGFEIALLHYRLAQDVQPLFSPELHQWRCTQAMCRKAAIPESLGGAAEFLKLDVQKEKIGEALIEVFSDQTSIITLEPPVGMIDPATRKVLKNGSLSKGTKPKNRKTPSPILDEVVLWDWRVKVAGTHMTVREAWDLFIDYCRKDVKVEQALHKKLGRFELAGDDLASFQFDMRMNHAGVPLNVAALRNAQTVIEQYQEKVEARMTRMCGLRSGQRDALLLWLRERGYPEDNLQADTVDEVLQSGVLSGVTLEVLKCRALLAFAAIKKIPTMLKAVCPDGRVRGTMVWHGTRTGRATGRIVQVQNVKKATIKDPRTAYALICDGAPLEIFESLWESPLEAIASCVRHFIQFPDGDLMFDADFTGVEARIAAWVSDEEEKLQSILDNKCQYRVMASEIIYNIPYEEVTKEQRTVGKPVELSCVYGTGGKGLMTALWDNHGVKKTLSECNAIVKAYRAKFANIKKTWDDMEAAAKLAVTNNQVSHVAGGRISFGCIRTAGVRYLVMRLPSGRRMFYPNPEIKPVFKKYDEEEMREDPWKRDKKGYWIDSLSFYGKHKNIWRRIHTWGSRLFENACFVAGSEVLTEEGWVRIEELKGQRVFDGVEFVSHAGLSPKYSNEVISLDGLGVTRNHLILTTDGWTHAENTDPQDAYQTCREICSRSPNLVYQGYGRNQGGVTHGNPCAPEDGKESRVGVSVRMWEHLHEEDSSAHSDSTNWFWRVLLLLLKKEDPTLSRDVTASGLRGLSEHVGPLPTTHTPILSQLRRARDSGLQKVAGFIRELLGGYGRQLPKRSDAGSRGQRERLLAGKLSVGDTCGELKEHSPNHLSGNAIRDAVSFGDSSNDGDRGDDHNLPSCPRSKNLGGAIQETLASQQVFDILNCGPRNRFVIRAPGGQPLIAHNCQAIGADLLHYGCRQAEAAGYEIAMIVHDQALARDNGLPLEGYSRALCDKQPWAESFPLAASSDLVPYYLKEE